METISTSQIKLRIFVCGKCTLLLIQLFLELFEVPYVYPKLIEEFHLFNNTVGIHGTKGEISSCIDKEREPAPD